MQAEYEFERNARNEYRQEAELPSLRYEAELRNESDESERDFWIKRKHIGIK